MGRNVQTNEKPPPGGAPTETPVPAVERETDEAILVGHGGPLIVPHEDIGVDLDDGEDLDLGALQAKKIRRPGRREWIAINPARELTTRLLPRRSGPNGLDVEYYFVVPAIRAPIRDELKTVRVFPFWSFATKSFGLWVVSVTVDNSWYESLAPLFQRPAGFYAEHAFRVLSDRANARYRVKFKEAQAQVRWPSEKTEALLGEALGPTRFIASASHPVYQELVEGADLD